MGAETSDAASAGTAARPAAPAYTALTVHEGSAARARSSPTTPRTARTIYGSGDSTCQSIRVDRTTQALATLTAFGRTWGPHVFAPAGMSHYNAINTGKVTPLPAGG